ncbi:MAG: uridine kinase [Actinomycetaceae bacterium]|nr:uridine kinase [Actinomycetaceae bacterium]
MRKPLVVGISGGTGSGKTTLTVQIAEHFAPQVAVVFHDSYYKAHNGLGADELNGLNYDHPDAFDNDLLVAHLQALIAGNPVEAPVYDYAVHNRSTKTQPILPAPLILVEGIVLFTEPRLLELCDIKVFVDVEADVRVLRRIKRDVVERGRSIESVESQYLSTVKPMHDIYVEPSKRHADIIVPQGGHNQVALRMLIGAFEAELQNS